MPLGLHLGCLSVGVPLAVAMPVGDTVPFALALAIDLTLATMALSLLASGLLQRSIVTVQALWHQKAAAAARSAD